MDPKPRSPLEGHPGADTPSEQGDEPLPEALDDATAALYSDLKRLAASYVQKDRKGLTLSATDLVHEAYGRLAGDPQLAWSDRGHFMALAATAMRRLLIEHARHHGRLKRGAEWQRVTFDAALVDAGPTLEGSDLLALDEALGRLASLDARQAKVVEMRFFSGLGLADIAEVLGVTRRTVDRDWAHAKSWLRRELATDGA